MSDALTVNDLVSKNSVRCHLSAGSRKRLFQAIAHELVDPAREDGEEAVDEIYDALVERERLGSTALGDGVAIPHCRTDCKTIAGAFYTLEQPIDYEAPDQRPVDIVFVLLVPRHEQTAHIAALQRLAQLFSDPSNLSDLRAAVSDQELFRELLRMDSALDPPELNRKLA